MDAVISAEGHHHVQATHRSTLEVTTEPSLTPAGDCIIGVGADLAPSTFNDDFRHHASDEAATIEAHLEVDGMTLTITGRGHPDLTFKSSTSAVIRTSRYVDDRTVMVDASHAALDIDRDIVTRLTDGAPLRLTLSVLP